MIAVESVAVILLAAGLSTRFGPRDKLSEALDGLPLGLHAARTFASIPFAARIVVTRNTMLDFAAHGFTSVINQDPGAGQSASIRLGIAQARTKDPGAVLIALADMPRVSSGHVGALLHRFDEEHPIVASLVGDTPGPPALFGASSFDRLEALDGDRGARALLRDAALVAAPASMLVDVDTPGDLAIVARSAVRTPNL